MLFISLLAFSFSALAQTSFKIKVDRQSVFVNENPSFLSSASNQTYTNKEKAKAASFQVNYYLNKYLSIGSGIGIYSIAYSIDQDILMSDIARQLRVSQSRLLEEKNYKLVEISVANQYLNIPFSFQLDLPNANTPKWQSYFFLESDLLLKTNHKVESYYRDEVKRSNYGSSEYPGASIFFGILSAFFEDDPIFTNTSISAAINQELSKQVSPKVQVQWSLGVGFKRYLFEDAYLLGETYWMGHKNKMENSKAGFTFGLGVDFGKN